MPVALLLAAAAFANGASNAETVRFKSKEVLVSDSGGIPLFRGTRAFVLKLGHNPTGSVVAYDERSKRVRLSTKGTELWVDCAELEPMTTTCSQTEKRAARSAAIRGDVAPAAASAELLPAELPSCPADPRCPSSPE